MDIEDEFSRHLLSGDVHEDELATIRETTTKHEPQIALVRDKIHQMIQTGAVEPDIPGIIMKNRGKGQHDFTVEGFEAEYFDRRHTEIER